MDVGAGVLLQLFDELTPIWGQPSELYGLSALLDQLTADLESSALAAEFSVVDVEKEAKALRCFFHPNEPFRTVWDFTQVILLLYLLVTVPLRVAFDTEVEFGTVSLAPIPMDIVR